MHRTLLTLAIATFVLGCGSQKKSLEPATKEALLAHKNALCACTQLGGPECAAELDRSKPAPRVSADGLPDGDRRFLAEVQALEAQCRGTLADLAQFRVDVERERAEREQVDQSLRAIEQLGRKGAL